MRVAFGKKNIVSTLVHAVHEFIDKSTNGVMIVFIIVLFIILNYAMSFVPFRIDVTENKAYSLSEGTRKILRNLDDVVNVSLFISSDLPTRLSVLERDVRDFLEEYRRNARNTNIIVKYKDPKKNEVALKEAQDLGVPELQFSQIENDKYAVSAAYFGMAIQYGAKFEIIPSVMNLETLEYDITSAIYRLTRKEKTTIGFIGVPSFVPPQEDDIASIRQIFQREYNIVYPFNDEKKTIDQSIKILFLFTKEKPYSDDQLSEIKKFIDEGKSVIIFAQGLTIGDDLSVQEANHNLFNFLSSYGLVLEKKHVLSMSSELANFSTGTINYFVPYPFWLKTGQFNSILSELSNVGYLMFPWASPITKKDQAGMKYTLFVSTEPYSWILDSSVSLNPNDISEPKKEEVKKIPLIYQVKKGKGSLILIPSDKFLDARFVSRAQGNINFVFNMTSVLSSDGLLAGIRSRQARIVPIRQITDQTKDIIKYSSIGLFPGLLMVVGIAYLLKQK